MKTFIYLVLLLSILPFSAYAEPCGIIKTTPVNYSSEARGEVTIYKTDNPADLNVTNIACTIGTEFFSKITSFPDKATLGIVDSSFSNAVIVQWNLTQDYFLIIQVSGGMGTFLKYPAPLDRIKEVLTNAQFPKREQLPVYLQKRFSSNLLKANPTQVKRLIEGN